MRRLEGDGWKGERWLKALSRNLACSAILEEPARGGFGTVAARARVQRCVRGGRRLLAGRGRRSRSSRSSRRLGCGCRCGPSRLVRRGVVKVRTTACRLVALPYGGGRRLGGLQGRRARRLGRASDVVVEVAELRRGWLDLRTSGSDRHRLRRHRLGRRGGGRPSAGGFGCGGVREGGEPARPSGRGTGLCASSHPSWRGRGAGLVLRQGRDEVLLGDVVEVLNGRVLGHRGCLANKSVLATVATTGPTTTPPHRSEIRRQEASR